jgi:hypothetical protein
MVQPGELRSAAKMSHLPSRTKINSNMFELIPTGKDVKVNRGVYAIWRDDMRQIQQIGRRAWLAQMAQGTFDKAFFGHGEPIEQGASAAISSVAKAL